mmetsp:Transcript_37348/g.90199  ORF Transcript_37348/g.90199 Transcript_37348/m.90199 type:complete len:704 (-) Transcript_37348:31-2142(-)
MTRMASETKKKIRPGLIAADAQESQILVHYETDEIVDGKVVDTKQAVKKIRLNSLSPSTDSGDIQALAQDVVDKCKLISQSKIGQVVKCITELVERQSGRDEEDFAEWNQQMDRERRGEVDRYMAESQFDMGGEGMSLENLDSYLEKLYEDEMDDKIKATFMILQLVRDPDNLEVLVENEQFLGALTRIFREEARKSMDLVINIVYIFFAFSNFSTFHNAMTQYKVGDMVMRVVELELKRDAHRKEELEKKKADIDPSELETQMKKMRITEKKQDKLLFVCFRVLMNLAEDITIERKMKKRKITPMLVQMLERKSPELVLLAVAFLKKLSIFLENKNEMIQCGVTSHLLKHIPSAASDNVVMGVLRLMLNLSFDTEIRTRLVQEGVITKLVDLMRKPHFRHVCLKLLYHISMDDKCKSMFTYTDCIPIVINMVANFPEKQVEKTLIALAINLSNNPRNAGLMAANETLNTLLSRLFQTKDVLLAKMLRNISQHDDVKSKFGEFVSDIAALACQADDPNLLVELLGILGNMTLSDVPFAKILTDFDMINFLHKHLAPGASEDDIVLELVIFIGTCIQDPKCAPIFANSHLVAALYDLMADKQEDDEIVLQITYTLFRCLQHECTRVILLEQTQVVSYFVDLLYDKNAEIRKMADQTLDLVMEYDEEWATQIRLRKFQIYNAEWIQAIEREDGGGKNTFATYRCP